ncbi:MAG: pantetheine-phosphate adenylyltransferase [Victivallaceae bacterium]
MRTVLYPGSFDPLTNGHYDLIERAVKIFDRVIVAVAINSEKNPLFSVEERMELIRQSCRQWPNVEVLHFSGLLVEAKKNYHADAILRGLRAFSDFEYELQMALMNRSLDPECETLFMMPNEKNSFVSSRLVKEVAKLGGDFSAYVPESVHTAIVKKLKLE